MITNNHKGQVLLNPFDDEPARLKSKLGLTYAALILANLAAWGWAMMLPQLPILLGTAFLAYSFGLRHAFDADHIAAIDNVVRKLSQSGKAPYSTGFFFSLGHSTVVVIASVVIAIAAKVFHEKVVRVDEIGGVAGTVASASFLLLIAGTNLVILARLWRASLSAKCGGPIVDDHLEALFSGRGLLARLFRPLYGFVTRSWHMYLIGFLFGLGFDTATEIGLLGISASEAVQNLPFWTVLVFPALFTAGMSLMDTTDSVVMTGAYGWAFITPLRRLRYNLAITAASVGIAFFVGAVEALDLIGRKFGFEGSFWRCVTSLAGNLTEFGLAVVGILVAIWLLSMTLSRSTGKAAPSPR